MIHLNHEVQPHRARLVLPWGTRWEARVTNVLKSDDRKLTQFATRGSRLILTNLRVLDSIISTIIPVLMARSFIP